MLTNFFKLKNLTKWFLTTILATGLFAGSDIDSEVARLAREMPGSQRSPKRSQLRSMSPERYSKESAPLSLEGELSSSGSTMALSTGSLGSPRPETRPPTLDDLLLRYHFPKMSFFDEVKTECPMIGHIFEEAKYFREKMENPCNFKELHLSGILKSTCDISQWNPLAEETVGQTIGRISQNAGTSFYKLLMSDALSRAQAKHEVDHRCTLGVVAKLIKMISEKRTIIIERIERLYSFILARPYLMDQDVTNLVLGSAEQFVDQILLNPDFILGLILFMNFVSSMSCKYCDRRDIGPIMPERCSYCTKTGFAQPWYLGDQLKQLKVDECFLDIPIGFYVNRCPTAKTSRMCKLDYITGRYISVRLVCNDCYFVQAYRDSVYEEQHFTIQDLICFLLLCTNAIPRYYQ